MRRMATGLAIAVFALRAAGPVGAAAPERESVYFTVGPSVFAECDGYDVLEILEVSAKLAGYFDNSGEFVREINHSSTTGTYTRSDTGEQLATFTDVGGTFTATPNPTFTFTGIHSEWTLSDGTAIRFVGRVVVAEVEPGVFERIFEAGKTSHEFDPCTW